jgi:hypothetical protein
VARSYHRCIQRTFGHHGLEILTGAMPYVAVQDGLTAPWLRGDDVAIALHWRAEARDAERAADWELWVARLR